MNKNSVVIPSRFESFFQRIKIQCIQKSCVYNFLGVNLAV
jgi:hypothetical protein